MVKYWLLKTETKTFQIKDFLACPNQTTVWEGVRNYKARNLMRDQMKLGDLVFIYHTELAPGIVGTAEVVKTAYADPFQFDPKSKYFDSGSDPHNPNPRWVAVDLQLREIFKKKITLTFIKSCPELKDMVLLHKSATRLSVQPVSEDEWNYLTSLAHAQED